MLTLSLGVPMQFEMSQLPWVPAYSNLVPSISVRSQELRWLHLNSNVALPYSPMLKRWRKPKSTPRRSDLAEFWYGAATPSSVPLHGMPARLLSERIWVHGACAAAVLSSIWLISSVRWIFHKSTVALVLGSG